jgi:ComF family protein
MRHVKLRALTRQFLDFCYPGACAVCSTSCEGDVPLCETCRIALATLEFAAACEKCGMPLKESGSPCPYCKGKGVAHFERVLRLGVYEDPLKHLIHQMKYHRAWTLAEFLADRLVDQEPVKSLLHETHVIVPVPLFFTRHIARGFNQAEVIARRIAKVCDIQFVKALTRVRATETQTHLSPTQRVENLRGAFALIAPKYIAGRHVVLVDDVTTTGATLRAAAQALEQAHPASLSALALAIADPKGRGFEVI